MLVAYFAFVKNRRVTTISVSEAVDVEEQKRFQCIWICLTPFVEWDFLLPADWCRVLAHARTTHSFDQADVHKIICQHLQSAFRLSLDQSDDVAASAHDLILEYGQGGLPCARELIAEAVLSRMRHIMSTKDNFGVGWQQMLYCMQHLESVVRSLTKPQRQEWVSLLVTGLHRLECRIQSFKKPRAASATEYFKESQKWVIEDLMLLWCVDDDPGQTYEEVKPQLRAWQGSSTLKDVRNSLVFLLRC
ncbi:unnamed protein product [Symbiodinium sp. CCMP2592]|nr:unnamed protein product [Symbiodinium sp. CCMP2592]